VSIGETRQHRRLSSAPGYDPTGPWSQHRARSHSSAAAPSALRAQFLPVDTLRQSRSSVEPTDMSEQTWTIRPTQTFIVLLTVYTCVNLVARWLN
jgi:hypothetical protein